MNIIIHTFDPFGKKPRNNDIHIFMNKKKKKRLCAQIIKQHVQ